MARVTITIEDSNGGKVKVVSSPTFEMMMKKTKFEDLTSAEGYAVCALNAIRNASKKQGSMIIQVPKLFGRN